MCDRARFFGKNLHLTKNDKKWSKVAQKQGFWTENHVISFFWNWCKTKVLIVH